MLTAQRIGSRDCGQTGALLDSHGYSTQLAQCKSTVKGVEAYASSCLAKSPCPSLPSWYFGCAVNPMKLACVGAPKSTRTMQMVASNHLCLRAGQVPLRRSQFHCVQEQLVSVVMAATRPRRQLSLLRNGWRCVCNLWPAIVHTAAHSGDEGIKSATTDSRQHASRQH